MTADMFSNLIMVLLTAFTCFQLGRVYEITLEVRKLRIKMEKQEQFYGSSR